MEQLMPLAGEGTPPVAEFAPAELAAALGISTFAGQHLVGDALELRHRLPRLWARIMAGTLQAWRGRKIADHTRTLSRQAAAWVDTQIAPYAHKISLGRVLKLIEAAILRFNPDQAAERARQTAEHRGVWVGDEMTDGTRSIHIDADALDAAAFDQTIDHLAHAMADLGDHDHHDLRRAKAVGVIADPQGALDLLTDGPDSAGTAPDDRDGTTPGQAARRGRRTGRPQVTLYLHLHESAIRNRSGVARVEGLGPVLTQQVKDWVGRSEVTIKPVLDLADRTSVDAYEVPDRIGETVLLRDACCPFPWCNNQSRHRDKDHIDPYIPPDQGGPPGQTAADKLVGLCRRHHRLKTHGGWTYTMPDPGIYLWKSPHGRRYLVDHTGTTPFAHAA
jgi:hypothetical protein